MKFLSIDGLIDFMQYMIEEGYTSSINIDDISYLFYEKGMYISQYNCRIYYHTKVVAIHFYYKHRIEIEITLSR